MNARFRFVFLAALFGLALLPAAASADFSQGFETDTSGWFDNPPGTIHRVASGYSNSGEYADGIASATGGFHARLRTTQTGGCAPAFSQSTSCQGPYTDWGDGFGNPTFPAGGYTTQADIYLDVAWAATHPDYRFDWDSSIDDNTGNFLSDVVFNVGTEPTGFVVGASPNAFRGSTFPSNPCPNPSAAPNYCRVPAHITTSGWYTFRHYFHDDGSGNLRVDMTVLNSVGTPVASWFLYPGPTPPTPISMVGGNDYGWFANQEIQDLAIDNTQLRTAFTPCTAGTKANFRWHYSANGSAGGWSGTKSVNCPGSLTMGPQAMEGDLKVSPGDTLKVGYDFTIPGSHPPTWLRVEDPQVTFQVRCVSGATPSATSFTVDMSTSDTFVTDSKWYPSGDQKSPLVYQGSTSVLPLCGPGEKLRLDKGGTFTANVK